MRRIHLKLFAIGISLSTGLASTIAVKSFFDRPGESAVALIPDDVKGVVTVDLVPSASQVLAFRDIENALRTSGTTKSLLNTVADHMNEPELGRTVAPFLGRSLAVGVFPDKGKAAQVPANWIAFVALKDEDSAEIAVRKAFKPVVEKSQVYYPLKSGRFVRFADGYLEVASNASYFKEVDEVRGGQRKSISSVELFRIAHALVEPGANVALYVMDSGNAVGISGEIEQAGIQVAVRSTKGAVKAAPQLTSLKPLSASSLGGTPSNAYMLLGISQLAVLLGGATKLAGNYEPMLNSALSGDTIIGLYPSERSPRAGVDLLIEFSNANGAKPVTAFKKLIKGFERDQLNGESLFGRPSKIGRGSYATITGQLRGALKQKTKAGIRGANAKLAMNDKTFAFAADSETLYLSSSVGLIKRSVQAKDGTVPSTLLDPAFKPASDAVLNGSQLTLDVSLSRIAEGITNTTTKHNEGAKTAVNVLKALTHGSDLLSLSAGVKPDGAFDARLFVPLNYSALSRVAAKL